MKRTSLTEAKAQLSALVDFVQGGETVLLLDRGRPVARLSGVVDAPLGEDERLLRLERRGVVRRATAPPPLELMEQAPPATEAGVSALSALLEERLSGR